MPTSEVASSAALYGAFAEVLALPASLELVPQEAGSLQRAEDEIGLYELLSRYCGSAHRTQEHLHRSREHIEFASERSAVLVLRRRSSRPHDGSGESFQDGFRLVYRSNTRHSVGPLHEPAGRFNLWPHGTRGKGVSAEFLRRGPSDRPPFFLWPAGPNGGNISQEQKDVRIDGLCEQCSGQILVDDRLGTLEPTAGAGDDGNAASSRANDDGASAQKQADCVDLPYALWCRRGYGAPPPLAVADHRP